MIPITLTRRELEIMGIVCEHGEVTVRVVYETTRARRRIAYTTIMTMMNILERKGYLAKGRRGKAFVYIAVYSRDEIVKDLLRELIDVFYGGSPERVLNILSQGCGDRSCR